MTAFAEGTRTWEQSKFDELIKGTATGVAIRSSGGLELAPTFKSLYATPSTYIWAIAADDAGNVYAAAGAPARVYRITPEGKATIIFEPKELQVQALQIGLAGTIYAATAPDGKVYKIEHKPASKAAKTEASQAVASERDRFEIQRRSLPGVHPSISSRARNISGTWLWISPAICTLLPGITAKFSGSRPKANIPFFSKATKLTSECWHLMRSRTSSPVRMAVG